MAFDVTREVRDGYHLYRIAGVNSKRNFIELADALHEDHQQTSVYNFVLDCAGIKGSLDIGQLFEVGAYFARTLKACKLAGINTPAEWRNNTFSENVIHNRGGELEHFPSLEAAETWFSKQAL
jgi:hypothetical protein